MKYLIYITFLIQYLIVSVYTVIAAGTVSVSDFGVFPASVENIIGSAAGLFVYVIILVSIIAVVIGGIYYILGGAKTSNADKGKKMIEKAITGFIIGLSAYTFIYFISKIIELIFP